MRAGHHLSLSLSKELWEDLLSATLPIGLAEGAFQVMTNTRLLMRQLQVRERVASLLEDRPPPVLVQRAAKAARLLWHHQREGVIRRVHHAVHIDGHYEIRLDDMGSQFRYGHQQVGVDAFLKIIAEGKVVLLKENIEIPFSIEKRIGVSLTLGDIRFDRNEDAVTGSIQDLALHLGKTGKLQWLARMGESLLEQQLPRVNPIPILKREQVEEMVSGFGGSLKMRMGVETLELFVTEEDLTLSVKFGFTQKQLLELADSSSKK